MKNVTWLLFLSVICVLPVRSQSIFLTPRAGLNLATITQADAGMKTGLNFGISGEYVYAPKPQLAAVAGLFYSMQGCNLKGSAVNPEHNCLNLPVLFKYYVNAGTEGNNKGFSFFAGPQLDVKAVVNKVSYIKEDIEHHKKDPQYDILRNNVNKTLGMSAVIGAEYLFDVGLTLSANVNIGLTNNTKDQFAKGRSYKDMVIQINFGYRFSIL
ncbi:MAG: PorT family protein [Tannerellaceae bacterium]|jgi:hypothetical protein|nr:PorT family protein [Tannerellaceae bacterium]